MKVEDVMLTKELTWRHFVYVVIIAALAMGSVACERRSAKVSRCVSNLHDIQDCKQMWVGDNGKASGDVPTWDDLRHYFPDRWSNSIPVCPSGGAYKIGRNDEAPTCSIGGLGHSIKQ